MREKILTNALIGEQLQKFSREEKHNIICELLQIKQISLRSLSKEIGINYSTVQDWYSLRQNNKEGNQHISIRNFILKLKKVDIKNFNDWGRVEELKEVCEKLLQQKANSKHEHNFKDVPYK